VGILRAAHIDTVRSRAGGIENSRGFEAISPNKAWSSPFAFRSWAIPTESVDSATIQMKLDAADLTFVTTPERSFYQLRELVSSTRLTASAESEDSTTPFSLTQQVVTRIDDRGSGGECHLLSMA